MSKARRYVVVGGVAAGMSAASQIRRRKPRSRVVLLERGPHVSYGACGMPYNIQDPKRRMDDLVVLDAERARSERGIDVRLGCRATAIDLDRGVVVVHDENGDGSEAFDALVLATGAQPQRPALPGFDLPGVVTLRDLADGVAVKELLASGPRHAVIVGGGYIGMEMAHVLTDRGLEVTVAEKLPRILDGFDEATVEVVASTLDEHGVTVRTGCAVESAEAGPDGRVASVVLDGETVPAEVVLVATGIQPNVTLATDAGLRIGSTGAIWVNQYQQTSHEAVWAAGDCAEAYHRILRKNAWIPLGSTANKQGRIAGANATGAGERFRGIVGTIGFAVFDLEVARSGLGLDQAREEGFDPVALTVRQRSRGHGIPGGAPVQVTLVADEPTGLLLGGELVGVDGAALRVNALATALSVHLTVADLQQLDLVYAPPFAPVWDPLLVAANELAKKVGRMR